MTASARLARPGRRPLPFALAALALVAGCGSDDDGDAGGNAADVPALDGGMSLGADVDDAEADAGAVGDDPLGADGTGEDGTGEDGADAGDELGRRVVGIVVDVLDAVDGVVATPVPRPDVAIETTPSLIFYQSLDDSAEESVVVVPRWEEIGEGQALFESWAGTTGGAYDGRRLFEELFNWFFVAHEVGHHLQALSAQGPATRRAEELQANEIAVAYLAATEPARLEALVSALGGVRDSLEVPERADDPAFFEEEYDAIGEMPEVYGYFQFGFVLDAWSRVDELDLETIVIEDLAL